MNTHEKRKALYTVFGALLGLLGIYGLVTVDQSKAITDLVMSLVDLLGALGFVMAGNNARPSELDVEKGRAPPID